MHLGADVNAVDFDDVGALHVAARRGDVELARELLNLGADSGARDRLIHGTSSAEDGARGSGRGGRSWSGVRGECSKPAGAGAGRGGRGGKRSSSKMDVDVELEEWT